MHDGKELVLEAGVSLTIYLKIAGVKLADTSFTKKPDFDFGQNFVPPFGNCGTNCGFDVWILADVTHSTIRFVGVTGSARVGVKVAGDGEIKTQFQALVDGKAVDSWASGAKKEAKKTHSLEFDETSDKRTRKVAIAKLASPDDEKRFGYLISDAEYEWNVDLIPGVRGDIDIYWKIYKDSFMIGPYWLNSLKLDLGTFEFGPHAGTTTSVEVQHGSKTWRVLDKRIADTVKPPGGKPPAGGAPTTTTKKKTPVIKKPASR